MRSVAAISQQIWDMKYRLKSPDGGAVDRTIEDTWRRVATALAEPEKDPKLWADRFYEALADFKFLPAGRDAIGLERVNSLRRGRDVTRLNGLAWKIPTPVAVGMLDRGELVDHAVGQRRSRLMFQVKIHRRVTGEDGRLRMKGGLQVHLLNGVLMLDVAG